MRLSVCIPVFNVAPYIEQCARSLFAQTYRDIEYVFVDDCSPDDSMDIVRRVLKDYPERAEQVRFLRHEKNRGLIVARQTALKNATGDLVAHCDSDDWVDTDLYERVVAYFSEPSTDLVYFSMRREYPDGSSSESALPDYDGSPDGFFALADGMAGFNCIWNKVMRRRVALSPDIECPDDIGTGEDLCYVAQALDKCREIRFAKNAGCGYHYRQNPTSMTQVFVAEKVLHDLTHVYEVVSRKVPMSLTAPIRRQLSGSILYFGARSGRWTARDMREWRGRLREAGGTFDFPWLNEWGRRYMKIAAVSLPLAALFARVAGKRIGYA